MAHSRALTERTQFGTAPAQAQQLLLHFQWTKRREPSYFFLMCLMLFGLWACACFKACCCFASAQSVKHLASEFLKLFNRHRFGFIGSGTIGDGLIHLVSYLLESPISVRPIGEAFVQSFCSGFLFWQFIAHELLYLYITSKSTISKLRIFDRQFQSHPTRGLRLAQSVDCAYRSLTITSLRGQQKKKFERTFMMTRRNALKITAGVTATCAINLKHGTALAQGSTGSPNPPGPFKLPPVHAVDAFGAEY